MHGAEPWVTLRRWVDWFTNEHRLPSSAVPQCWFQHTEITAELYAAMCFEQKVWDAEAPTVAPSMYWQAQLPEMRRRLSEMTTATTCREGAHKPVERRLVRTVDEDAWKATIRGRTDERTVTRPEEGKRFVRAVLKDRRGKVLTQSSAVGLQTHAQDQTPAAEIGFSVSPGDADEVVQLHVKQGHAVAKVQWEESSDQRTWTALDQESDEVQSAE